MLGLQILNIIYSILNNNLNFITNQYNFKYYLFNTWYNIAIPFFSILLTLHIIIKIICNFRNDYELFTDYQLIYILIVFYKKHFYYFFTKLYLIKSHLRKSLR
jgi:hypothetical protein